MASAPVLLGLLVCGTATAELGADLSMDLAADGALQGSDRSVHYGLGLYGAPASGRDAADRVAGATTPNGPPVAPTPVGASPDAVDAVPAPAPQPVGADPDHSAASGARLDADGRHAETEPGLVRVRSSYDGSLSALQASGPLFVDVATHNGARLSEPDGRTSLPVPQLAMVDMAPPVDVGSVSVDPWDVVDGVRVPTPASEADAGDARPALAPPVDGADASAPSGEVLGASGSRGGSRAAPAFLLASPGGPTDTAPGTLPRAGPPLVASGTGTTTPVPPFPPWMVAAAVVLAGATLGVLGRGRTPRFWPVGLFSRIDRDSVLAHDARRAIHEHVESEPGIHMAELSRRTGIGGGGLQYHVRVLARNRMLVVRKQGHYTCLYLPGGTRSRRPGFIAAGHARDALALVQANPGITGKELAQRLGVCRATIQYHVDRLAERGLLHRQRDGRVVRFWAG